MNNGRDLIYLILAGTISIKLICFTCKSLKFIPNYNIGGSKASIKALSMSIKEILPDLESLFLPYNLTVQTYFLKQLRDREMFLAVATQEAKLITESQRQFPLRFNPLPTEQCVLMNMINKTQIQNCDSSIKSKKTIEKLSISYSTKNEEERKILNNLYKEFKYFMKKSSPKVYECITTLRVSHQQAISLLYLWCHITTNTVHSSSNYTEILDNLLQWTIRTKIVCNDGELEYDWELPFIHFRSHYHIPKEIFMDQIRGVYMDLPLSPLFQYETYQELLLYCYRMSGTVGLMILSVFGFTDLRMKDCVISLGISIQLTTILRNFCSDVKNSRIYVPYQEMIRYNVTKEQFIIREKNKNYNQLMEYQVTRTKLWYSYTREGITLFDSRLRRSLKGFIDIHETILDTLEL